MKKILSLFFTIFLLSQCCMAEEWYQIEYKEYLKLEKVQDVYSYYWVKKLNNYDIPRVNNRKVSYNLFYFVDNCAENTYATLAVYQYGISGDALFSYVSPNYQNPDANDFEPIVPQSNGEAMHKLVCKDLNTTPNQ